MAESLVVSGLIAKHAELARQIQHFQTMIQRLAADLKHLDATIKLFSPEFYLRTVRAKEHRERNQYFKQGECPRMTLNILRESGGALTSRQIAEAMLQRKGLESNVEMIEQLQKNALAAVKGLENKKLVVQGDMVGVARTWRIA